MQLELLSEPDRHKAGNCSGIPLARDVTGSAEFDGPRDCYRYVLERLWDPNKLTALVILMNPSTADPLFDDRTVAKATKMVRGWSWGGVPHAFGRMLIGNSFAYRCTDQSRLLEVPDPIGPGNDASLRQMAREAALVVFAYGTPKAPKLRPRGPQVVRMLMDDGVKPHALLVSNGRPWHLLYLPGSTIPFLWQVNT